MADEIEDVNDPHPGSFALKFLSYDSLVPKLRLVTMQTLHSLPEIQNLSLRYRLRSPQVL